MDLVERLVQLEYLGLSESDVAGLVNPFERRTAADKAEPHLHVLRLMRTPDYFYYTCKTLFNIELMPFQCVILKEMWNKRFPMLIASRGAGKSFLLGVYAVLRALLKQGSKVVICGSGFRQAKTVFNYAENIWHSSPMLQSLVADAARSGPEHGADRWVLRLGDSTITALPVGDGCMSSDTKVLRRHGFGTIAEEVGVNEVTRTTSEVWGDGEFRPTDESYRNGLKPTKVITTHQGYSFEATHNHRMKVVRGGHVEWIRSDRVRKGDRILIDRSWRWHDGEFRCSDAEAYALGLMIGDGSYCIADRLGYATEDPELIEALRAGTGYNFRQCADKVHFLESGWAQYADWTGFWGLTPERSQHKRMPSSILSAPRERMAACLSGIFDTDGHAYVSRDNGLTITVGLTNTSRELMEQVQFVLLHFGIVSSLRSRDRHENWNRVYELLISGSDAETFAREIGFRLPRKRRKLEEAIAEKSRSWPSGDTIPGLQELMVGVAKQNRIRRGRATPDSTAVSASKIAQRKGITHDLAFRFLGVYGHLDDPRVKRVRGLADPDVYYDEVVSIDDGECETFDIHVPDGHEYCASGFFSHNTKIRGERANCIIADEFACLDATTLVETTSGLMRIADSFKSPGFELFTGEGVSEPPERFIKTPKTDAYKVVTKGGYDFICSSIHKVKTIDGWRYGKDLEAGDKLEFENYYRFPDRYVERDGLVVDENLGWLMGILVAEGSLSVKHSMNVHMADHECVERTREAWLRVDPTLNVGICETGPREDVRGWTAKRSWTCWVNRLELREKFVGLGLKRSTAHTKNIPWSILQSPRSVVVAFLRGLFEGDGSAFHWTDRAIDNKFGVAYYSVSEELCREIQIVLKKLDIFCTRQTRSSKLSDNTQWMLRLNGLHALRLQETLDIAKWRVLYETAYQPERERVRGVVWDKSRGRWNAYSTRYGVRKFIGRYDTSEAAITAVLHSESDCLDYIEVKSVEKLDGQRHLYDYHVPKSHSFMGNGFRQHNSIPEEIFETVIAGFGVVNLSPVAQAKKAARRRVMKKQGSYSEAMADRDRNNSEGNQILISGTAFWQFNHFCKNWQKWKTIIECRGDQEALRKRIGESLDETLDWRDFMIVRFPHTLLPEGYYDAAQIARSRATIHSGIFANEFGAVFSSDSNGFYRRSMVESCTAGKDAPVTPDCEGAKPVWFDAVTRGNPAYSYVMGVDPAAEKDNFAIVILEVHETHHRVVYCWTTDKSRFNAKVKGHFVEEDTYYGYCATKIRSLLRTFPCEVIALDAQGGGQNGVLEALHDPSKMKPGERPIWPVTPDHPLSDGRERETDHQPGDHVVELVNFADAKWVSNANHGMRADFEARTLLFPQRDAVTLGEAFLKDQAEKRIFDTLEECVDEIDELKDELATITYSQTPGTLRDRWDTPEVKIAGSKKGRMRKDRYSALLMANHAARRLRRQFERPEYEPHGGFASMIDPGTKDSEMYSHAPDWFGKAAGGDFGEYGRVAGRPV